MSLFVDFALLLAANFDHSQDTKRAAPQQCDLTEISLLLSGSAVCYYQFRLAEFVGLAPGGSSFFCPVLLLPLHFFYCILGFCLLVTLSLCPFSILHSVPFLLLPSPSTLKEDENIYQNQSQHPKQWQAQRWTTSRQTASALRVRFEVFLRLFVLFFFFQHVNTLPTTRRLGCQPPKALSFIRASDANHNADDGARYERDDQRSASPRRDEGQESAPRRSASPGAAGDRYRSDPDFGISALTYAVIKRYPSNISPPADPRTMAVRVLSTPTTMAPSTLAQTFS